MSSTQQQQEEELQDLPTSPGFLEWLDETVGFAGMRAFARRVTSSSLNSSLSDKMAALSVDEREKVYEDIHGVSPVLEETPELVEESIQKLKDYLCDSLPEHLIKKRASFDLAVAKNSTYVWERELCLIFLRAREFDIPATAELVIHHYYTKHKLFGEAALVREVRQSDMDQDDIDCLRNGHTQLLPFRDRSNRAIICHSGLFVKFKAVENLIKSAFWLLCRMLHDEETQKHGVVLLFYNVGNGFLRPHPMLMAAAFEMLSAAPHRASVCHYCHNQLLQKPILALAAARLRLYGAVRLREHYGSHEECRYELLTFGIPVDDIMVTRKGVLQRQRHRQWLETQKLMEDQGLLRTCCQQDSYIFVPSRNDVLSGRRHVNFPGNIKLASLIDEKREEYNAANKHGKTRLTQWIADEIARSGGGRFLKEFDQVWVKIEGEQAREKVAHLFRSRRRGSLRVGGSSKKSDTGTCTTRSEKASRIIPKETLEVQPIDFRNPADDIQDDPDAVEYLACLLDDIPRTSPLD